MDNLPARPGKFFTTQANSSRRSILTRSGWQPNPTCAKCFKNVLPHFAKTSPTPSPPSAPAAWHDELAKTKAFVLDGLNSGALRPHFAKVFPLDKITEAHRYLESNVQIGKVIVSV